MLRIPMSTSKTKLIEARAALQFKRDVVDPHHLAAVDVDNLLVEQVAPHAQHVFVGVIGEELLVAELDAIKADQRNLVVADRKPGATGAYQKAVHAGLMDQRNECCVPNPADAPVFQVVDRQVEQLGEVQKCFRHVAVPQLNSRPSQYDALRADEAMGK